MSWSSAPPAPPPPRTGRGWFVTPVPPPAPTVATWIVGNPGERAGAAERSVAVGLTAAGVVGTPAQAPTAVAVGLPAGDAVLGTRAGAPTAVAVGLTAAGEISIGAGATVVAVGRTADGTKGLVGETIPVIIMGLTAAGDVSGVFDDVQGQADLTVGVGLDVSGYAGEWLVTLTAAGFAEGTPSIFGAAALAVGIELAASGSRVVASTATTAVGVGLTASGLVGAASGAATPVAVDLQAAGLAALTGAAQATTATVGRTASGTVTRSTGASTSLAATITAAGQVRKSTTAATAATVGLTAAGVVRLATGADTTATVGRPTAGAVGTYRTAEDTAVAVGLTADGILGTAGAGDVDFIVGVGASGDGTRGTVGAANRFVAVGLTAAGSMVAFQPTDSTDLTVGRPATGFAGDVIVGITAHGFVFGTPALLNDTDQLRATVGLTADGMVALGGGADRINTVATSAAGRVGKAAGAATAATVGLTAAGRVGTSSGATLAATVGRPATGAYAATTSLAVATGLTAAGQVGAVGQAATIVGADIDTSGIVQLYGQADTPVNVSGSADLIEAAKHYEDTFDRANVTPLDGDWTSQYASSAGSLKIVSNGVTASATSRMLVHSYDLDMATGDMSVVLIINGSAYGSINNVIIGLRGDTGKIGTYANITWGGTITIKTHTSWSIGSTGTSGTNRANGSSGPTSFTTGRKWRFQAVGDVYTLAMLDASDNVLGTYATWNDSSQLSDRTGRKVSIGINTINSSTNVFTNFTADDI